MAAKSLPWRSSDAAPAAVPRVLLSGVVGCVRALAFLAALVLSACQPLPQPFRMDTSERQANRLLDLPTALGIVVRPVAGLPAPIDRIVAEAVASAIRDAGVPASIEGGNRGSSVLTGAATLSPGQVDTAWQLQSWSGEALAAPRATIAVDTNGRMVQADLQRAARVIAAAVAGDAPAAPVASGDPTGIAVARIDGAPGDGRVALKAALEAVLRLNRVRVLEPSSPESALILADVRLGTRDGDRQPITIRWVLMLPDGTEIGAVEQRNAIRPGQLDGRWGELALTIAEAAWEGVAALIEAMPRADRVLMGQR